MEIKKIGDMAQDQGVKAILHGPSGSGKTFSIATIPNHEGILVLSAEAGLLSIKKTGADIDGVVIKSIDDLRGAFDFLKGEDGNKYHTVVLDSLTEIAQQVLSHNLIMHKDGRKAYGEMNETLMRLIKNFRDLEGKNVILICQQARMEDNESKIYFGPAMPGKTLAQWLPYATDLVGCLRVRKEEDDKGVVTIKRAIQFAEVDELYTAKNRGGLLNDYEPCDWSVIFEKLDVELKPKKGKKEKEEK